MKSNHTASDSKVEKSEQTAYIIGDGPEAHISAIKLKQKGMKNVIVIGMRFDAFTRSASFNRSVFYNISNSIAPLKLKPSDSRHIKDAERELHQMAKDLGVLFLTGKFQCFENRHLKISKQDEAEPLLIPTNHDDIVIDCTGTARAVLKSVNADSNDKDTFKFTSTTLKNNPHKAYASMRLYFTPDLLNVSIFETHNLNPVSYALAIEALRELGWQSYAIPFCRHYPQRSKSDISDEKPEKYVLYFQMPETSLQEKDKDRVEETALSVAKILLKLFRNNPDDRSEATITLHKASKKYPHKQRLTVFNVEPYQTNLSFYKGDDHFPTIFHAGDSTLAAPFVMGKSLTFGIDRTDALIDAIEIHDGLIKKINFKKYDSELSKKLALQKADINYAFEVENKRIQAANNKAKDIYFYAYNICKDPDDKEKIKLGLDTADLLQTINFQLENFADEEKGFKFDILLIDQHLKSLDVIIKAISKNQIYLSGENNNIYKLSDYCKKAGDYLFESKKYKNAIEFYEKAVDLHQNCFQYRFPSGLLNLYSNLIIVNLKKSNYQRALDYASLAEEIYSTVDLSERKNKLIIEKINFNKARSLLKKFEAQMKENEKEDHSDLIKQINSAIDLIASLDMASKLTQEFELIKQKYSRPSMEEGEKIQSSLFQLAH